jgi:hypothetical protein
MVRFVGIREDS